jgi:hypothetical protein
MLSSNIMIFFDEKCLLLVSPIFYARCVKATRAHDKLCKSGFNMHGMYVFFLVATHALSATSGGMSIYFNPRFALGRWCAGSKQTLDGFIYAISRN